MMRFLLVYFIINRFPKLLIYILFVVVYFIIYEIKNIKIT